MEKRSHVFISYSHNDISWVERLTVHLKPLLRDESIDIWDDRRIKPGSKWKTEIEYAISSACVAILLVSADFLASDFITENELPPLLKAAKSEGAVILPVIVSPCRFLKTERLSRFQAVNDPSKPLVGLTKYEQEEIFVKLSNAVEETFKHIKNDINSSDAKRSIGDNKENETLSNYLRFHPKIKVVGVGGGGCNSVQHIVNEGGIDDVDLFSINSDLQALERLNDHNILPIGRKITEGLGAGANPEIGKLSAEESKNEIRNVLLNTNLLFVTSGMGGGTGTGATPVVAAIARELNILTIAVVTKPFRFEGRKKRITAEEGIKKLKENVDSIIVIPNDRIFAVVDSKDTMIHAFSRVNEVLRWVVQGISEVLTSPGIVNVDFADLRTVMKAKGYAKMGVGVSSDKENRAEEAIISALDNPLTENVLSKSKQCVLANVMGGNDLSLRDVEVVGEIIAERFSDDTEIILGTSINEELKGQIRVIAVVTGYDYDEKEYIIANKANARAQSSPNRWESQ